VSVDRCKARGGRISCYHLSGANGRLYKKESHKGREVVVGRREVILDYLSFAYALGSRGLPDPLSGRVYVAWHPFLDYCPVG
jgi:hypothetical protein